MFLVRLFQVARRFEMEVQPQLVLLQKTVLNIEGLGRRLYPELDLWSTAKPILEEWMRNRMGPRATLDRIRSNFPELAETMPELVHLTVRRLQQASNAATPSREDMVRELRAEYRRESRRSRLALIGGSLIVGATVLTALGYTGLDVAGIPLLAWLLGLIGAGFWLGALRR